jgi:acetolactate synthase-1/2/3 large subunit
MFSGGMGAMGFSLPTAMGSLSFNSESSVVAFMGDGGFQMNIQELETVKHNKLPLKIFVLNNSSLGMVREFQDQYFNKNYQSTVLGYSCPNVKKIAEAYGIEYLMIKNNESFNLLDNIYCDKNPIIIEIKLNPNSVLRPKVVYGETIENQAPFLNDEKRQLLARLKNEYLN